MTAVQRDQSKVLSQLKKEYEENKLVYDTIPAMTDFFVQLFVAKKKIDVSTQRQLKIIKGITKTKEEGKATAASSTYEVITGLTAWANKTKNSDVLSQVNFTELAIRNLGDKVIVPTCRNIYDLAMANLPELLFYGVDAESMEQLLGDIDVCEVLLDEPKKQILDRAAETKEIKDLFTGAFALLKDQGDMIVVKFKKKNMATFNSYQAARAMPHGGNGGIDEPPTPPAV